MAKATIVVDAEYQRYHNTLMFLYSGFMAYESSRITRSNPGSADLGLHKIDVIGYKSRRIGMHTGNMDIDSDRYITGNFWGENYGYWNADESIIRKSIDALERVAVFGDIAYDGLRPPWGAEFRYFLDNYRNGKYGMQAVGVYNLHRKRVYFNLGNDTFDPSENDKWTSSTVFRHVFDGGPNYIRFEYDVETDRIINFDTNGPG